MQNSLQGKLCPRCQNPWPLNVSHCTCGHVFRTKFNQPPPVVATNPALIAPPYVHQHPYVFPTVPVVCATLVLLVACFGYSHYCDVQTGKARAAVLAWNNDPNGIWISDAIYPSDPNQIIQGFHYTALEVNGDHATVLYGNEPWVRGLPTNITWKIAAQDATVQLSPPNWFRVIVPETDLEGAQTRTLKIQGDGSAIGNYSRPNKAFRDPDHPEMRGVNMGDSSESTYQKCPSLPNELGDVQNAESLGPAAVNDAPLPAPSNPFYQGMSPESAASIWGPPYQTEDADSAGGPCRVRSYLTPSGTVTATFMLPSDTLAGYLDSTGAHSVPRL